MMLTLSQLDIVLQKFSNDLVASKAIILHYRICCIGRSPFLTKDFTHAALQTDLILLIRNVKFTNG